MVAYYAREEGWTTSSYVEALEWYRLGLTVITYHPDGRRYNWKTNTFE